MTPRGTLGLCCVHIAQLMTHPAIYTTPFTLQLCYKPLGILQRVTKSQKVHISSHDGLQKLHNINIVWYRSQGFPEREQSSRNFPLLKANFIRTIDLLFFIQWVYYSLTAILLPHKYLLGTLISYERGNGGSQSTSNMFASGNLKAVIKEYHLLIYFYMKKGR